MPSRSVQPGSDAEIVLAVASADLQALAQLYDRYGALAYSVALRVLNDAGLAEDVVQESFLKIWSAAESFDPRRGSVRTWLMTIVRNRSIDQLRGHGAHVRQELDLGQARHVSAVGPGSDPWQDVSLSLERKAVAEALSRLPAEQKQALELAYYGGYSQREIAAMSRVPLSTVKGRMRLALEKLHSYLEGKGMAE